MKLRACLLISFFFWTSLVTAFPAAAQTATDVLNANRRSEQIQREQQLRQQEDIERSRLNKRPPASIEGPEAPMPAGRGEGCRDIAFIEIIGAENMMARKKREIIAAYAGRCLGVTEIQDLLADITRYYIDAGYTTTRAYLPAQDLTTGTLRVNVVEGRTGAIELDEQSADTVNLANAFPGLEGEVLNLRDLEQGLDQLNRLSSNKATVDIAPGADVGQSTVTIRNETTKRWHVNITGDNYGSETTGRRQGGLMGSYDNLLGINDYISYTERRTIPFHDKDKRSRSRNFYMSVPYGYTTFTGGYSHSDYNSTLVTAANTSLPLHGDNESYFATIDHTLYRDQDSKLNMSLNITRKEASNFMAGQKLTVSSRTLTVADFGFDYSTFALGGASSFGVTYSRGLHALGAMDDNAGLPHGAPRAQFEKMSFNASYTRPFIAWNQDLTWSTQLNAQVAFDTLYGSEQISIGGIYTVRGFYKTSLANDHGFYMRNDMTLTKKVASVKGHDVVFRPYLGLDLGRVAGRADDTPQGTLVGGVAGFSIALGRANFDVFTGRPISVPNGMEREGSSTFGRFSLSF